MGLANARETLKIALVGMAVMLTLPLAYRLWLVFHPQTEPPRRSLSQVLEKSLEEDALRLLKTPVVKWTAGEKSMRPGVYAWLEAHETTVLPWEWTEEARRKDPGGFRRLWGSLFKEQEKALKARRKAEQRKLKALEREIWITETILAHRTNQLVRIQDYVATNVFPMTVRIERLSKGRFWGWNTREEPLVLSSREDWLSPTGGWFSVERQQALTERAALPGRMTARQVSAEGIAALQSLEARAKEASDSVAESETVTASSAEKALFRLIEESGKIRLSDSPLP